MTLHVHNETPVMLDLIEEAREHLDYALGWPDSEAAPFDYMYARAMFQIIALLRLGVASVDVWQ